MALQEISILQALEQALVERTRARAAAHEALRRLDDATRNHLPTRNLENAARASLARLDRAVAAVETLARDPRGEPVASGRP